MCPFFLQNRQVASMNLQSLALWSVMPHCGQSPFAKVDPVLPVVFRPGDTYFWSTLNIGIFEREAWGPGTVSLAASAAS